MLNADDISVGQYLTVREWLSFKDNSYLGDVLVVKAVNLPFVALGRLENGGRGQLSACVSIITLDIRQVDLIRLNPEYVRVVVYGEDGQAQSNTQHAQPATESTQQAVG